MAQLQAREGVLYLGDDILIVRYEEGDCDTIKWPLVKPKHLALALFDEIECGNLDCPGYRVKLPDGMLFDIQEHLT